MTWEVVAARRLEGRIASCCLGRRHVAILARGDIWVVAHESAQTKVPIAFLRIGIQRQVLCFRRERAVQPLAIRAFHREHVVLLHRRVGRVEVVRGVRTVGLFAVDGVRHVVAVAAQRCVTVIRGLQPAVRVDRELERAAATIQRIKHE